MARAQIQERSYLSHSHIPWKCGYFAESSFQKYLSFSMSGEYVSTFSFQISSSRLKIIYLQKNHLHIMSRKLFVTLVEQIIYKLFSVVRENRWMAGEIENGVYSAQLSYGWAWQHALWYLDHIIPNKVLETVVYYYCLFCNFNHWKTCTAVLHCPRY